MNAEKLIEMYRASKIEYDNTGFLDFNYNHGIQVTEEGLLELAPVEEWTIKDRTDQRMYPFDCSVVIDGVTFFAIVSQEELDELRNKA